MKRAVWLCMFLFGLFLSAHAQEVVVDTAIVEALKEDTLYEDESYTQENEVKVTDTLLVVNKWNYPADSIRSFRKQKDFSYIKNLDSLLKAWQNQQKNSQQKQVKPVNVGPAFSLFRLLLWTIAIAVVLFVVYRLFLSERGLFTSPTRNKQLELEEEPITDIEYLDQQLNEAIRTGNYRLAVRYMYLQSLSRIAEKGWLILAPDKTNYQYVKELAKPQLKNDFSRITLHYDYVWYGDFIIEQDVFSAVKKEFDQFQQKIRQA